MKLLLVLCAVIAMAYASYGTNNYPQNNNLGYGNEGNYHGYNPFYKPPHHRRGRHGRHGRRRHHRDSSDSSDSSSESRSRSSSSSGSHSYERDDYYHHYPMHHQQPNYGNMNYEAPAANTYGAPANDVPAPAPYGVNTFGGK